MWRAICNPLRNIQLFILPVFSCQPCLLFLIDDCYFCSKCKSWLMLYISPVYKLITISTIRPYPLLFLACCIMSLLFWLFLCLLFFFLRNTDQNQNCYMTKASKLGNKLREKTHQILQSSFTFSFNFPLVCSAVYRINLFNSISNILLGESRKRGEVLIDWVFIVSLHKVHTS